MSNAASQDRRRQRSSDDDGTEAETSPLAVMLLQKGLSEQQIVHDGWTALFSLSQEVVNVFVCAFLYHNAVEAELEEHATLDVLKVKPSSPLSCELWCDIVLYFLFDNRNLIGTAAVRDALLALQPLATTDGACQAWCRTFYSLADAKQQLFGTVEAREALLAMQPHVATEDACVWWCFAVSGPCRSWEFTAMTPDQDANKKLFGTAQVRDALVALQLHVTTAKACEYWCHALCDVTHRNAANARLFGTAPVRDALVAVQPQVTTAAACQQWCTAICNMALGATNQRLFGSAGVRDALVALLTRVRGACEWGCRAIYSLLALDANKQLFGTVEVRDALVAVQPQWMWDGGAGWCIVVSELTALGANRLLFRVAAVRDAHAALHDVAAATADGSKWWHVAAAVLR